MQKHKLLVSFLSVILFLSFFSVFSPQLKAQTYIFNLEKYGGYIRIPSFTILSGTVTYENTIEGFEFNITLSRNPVVNSFAINIERFGWNWFYQPPLDEELNLAEYTFVNATHAINGTEVLRFRPENVVGSYAVYSSYKGNEYKTGKVLHLYRPLLIDANGNRVWGAINVTGNTLTISADRTWLDNAVYPVVIDPSFGSTSAGGSSTTTYWNSAAYGAIYTLTEEGTVTTITAYVSASTVNCKAALYSVASDHPDSELVESGSVSIGALNWYSFSVTDTERAAADYGLCLGEGSGQGVWRYDTGSISDIQHYDLVGTFPATWSCDGHQYEMIMSIYANYTVAEPFYPYIEQISNVDSSADIGTHSNFTAQQYGPDLINDTMTEASSGGSTSNVFTDGFEAGNYNLWTDGGATTWSDASGTPADNATYGSPWLTHSGTYMADADNNDDGSLTTDDIDCSTKGEIGVSFWYMNDDLDGSDYEVYYYDGASYDLIDTIGDTDPEDTWLYWSGTTSDSQYMKSNFRLRLTAACGTGEVAFLDDVVINASAINYKLDLEEQFTEVPYDGDEWTDGELCIFTGTYTGTAENLQVQVWNGSWNTVSSSLTANSWNNISVLSYVTSGDLYIRFIGGTETSDTNQNTWMIDCVLLHLWIEIEGTAYIADLTQSVTSTYSVAVKTDFKPVFSQTTTTSWNELVKSAFLLTIPTEVSFTSVLEVIKSAIAYIADLSLSLSSSWNVLVQWASKLDLTQTITTTWNLLTQWTASTGLTQGVSTTWNTLLQWNAILDFTQNIASTWIIDVIKSAGAINYIVDLGLAVASTWDVDAVLKVGGAQFVNLVLSIATTWNINLLEVRVNAILVGAIAAMFSAIIVGAIAFLFMVARRRND